MEEKVEKALGQIKMTSAHADGPLTSPQFDVPKAVGVGEQLSIENVPLVEVEKKNNLETTAVVEEQQKKESIR